MVYAAVAEWHGACDVRFACVCAPTLAPTLAPTPPCSTRPPGQWGMRGNQHSAHLPIALDEASDLDVPRQRRLRVPHLQARHARHHRRQRLVVRQPGTRLEAQPPVAGGMLGLQRHCHILELHVVARLPALKVRKEHGAHRRFVCRVGVGSLRTGRRGAGTRRSVDGIDHAACRMGQAGRHMHACGMHTWTAGLATTMAFVGWSTACAAAAIACGRQTRQRTLAVTTGAGRSLSWGKNAQHNVAHTPAGAAATARPCTRPCANRVPR